MRDEAENEGEAGREGRRDRTILTSDLNGRTPRSDSRKSERELSVESRLDNKLRERKCKLRTYTSGPE